MERQYVGARYVPIFAEPLEWDNQRSFERLTIVTYLGSSYTSKKDVPPNILPTNTEYWALTGNYNAQVEQYRQEVIRTRELLNDSDVILVGDSYAFTPSSDESWVGNLKRLMPNTTFYNACVAGAGFTGRGTTNTYLNNIMQLNINNPDDISKIIVVGGYNDSYSNYNDIVTAISEFTSYCNYTYKNATIYVACVGVHYSSQEIFNNIINISIPAYTYSIGYKCVYLNCNNILHNKQFLLEDNYHPNSVGGYVLGSVLFNLLNGGLLPTRVYYKAVTDYLLTLVNGGLGISVVTDYNTTTVSHIGVCDFTLNEEVTGNAKNIAICDIPTDLPLFGSLNDFISLNASVGYTLNGEIKFATLPILLNYNDKKLYVKYFGDNGTITTLSIYTISGTVQTLFA